MIAFPFDQLNQSGTEIKRRDHHFLQAGITSKTRQCVENDRDLIRQLRCGREQAKVGINARGAMVIIAGAEVDILPQAIRIAAHHQHCLTMGL